MEQIIFCCHSFNVNNHCSLLKVIAFIPKHVADENSMNIHDQKLFLI